MCPAGFPGKWRDCGSAGAEIRYRPSLNGHLDDVRLVSDAQSAVSILQSSAGVAPLLEDVGLKCVLWTHVNALLTGGRLLAVS